MKMISYGKQLVDRVDIQAVVDVLQSNWLSQGPKVLEFEKEFARRCGAKYAVAVSSGTAALHLACLVAGLGPGREAVTTPISFLATSNAILYTGAKPIFADICEKSVNLDPKEVLKHLTSKTQAILPVHFAGLPCDMKELFAIAKKRNLILIEDACHALGAEYSGQPIGSCEYSDMTVFSFHPVKHITTGEGGCITTNNKAFYTRLLSLRHHGLVKSTRVQKKEGPWLVEMKNLGFNYRITDFQCALGLSQLKKLNSFLRRRMQIASQYNSAFSDLQNLVTLPSLDFKDRVHALHLYLFRLKKNKKRLSRRKLFDQLVERGIQPQVHYFPIYRQPYYRKVLGKMTRLPIADAYYDNVLSLPLYPAMTQADIDQVILSVRSILTS